MGSCARFAAACLVGVLGVTPQGAATAAELIILTNQGATPGMRELAAAFARASGHKVTVIQEEGAALERRIHNGPADLVTGNPDTIEELVKNGNVVASTVTPFVLAGLEIGIQQTNIMVGVPGTDYVGPLPGFLNKPCPSSVALSTLSKEPDAARAMIAFMISPEAAPLLRRTHVEPAGR